MLEVGSKAPDFCLQDQDGKEVKLSDFLGKKVILYFYPKDNTSGCTKQACMFKDLYPQFQEKDAIILGVSKDSVKSHKNFQTKYELPFTLLSDPDHTVNELYDVWKEKSMYGKKYWGTERSTYLIDENGIIEKAMQKVKPTQNPEDVLKFLAEEQ